MVIVLLIMNAIKQTVFIVIIGLAINAPKEFYGADVIRAGKILVHLDQHVKNQNFVTKEGQIIILIIVKMMAVEIQIKLFVSLIVLIVSVIVGVLLRVIVAKLPTLTALKLISAMKMEKIIAIPDYMARLVKQMISAKANTAILKV